MFANNIVIICLLITVGVNELITTFVTVGQYPDFQKHGINLETCGIRRISMIHEISFSKKCYQNVYKPIKVVETEETLQRKNVSDITERIYQGKNAGIGESPWTVLLDIFMKHPDNETVFRVTCTGSLITLDWVITASHCFTSIGKIKVFKVVVSAGSNKRDGLIKIPVSTNLSIFRHPKYTDEIRFFTRDVALIKLDYSYKRFHNRVGRYLINTICLPEAQEINFEAEQAYAFGWGPVYKYQLSEYLQRSDVTLLPYFECREMFCANLSIKHSRGCLGDSGGPLVKYLGEKNRISVLIGVMKGSWHHQLKLMGECQPNPDPTVTYELQEWIAVPKVIEWILNTVRFN